VKYLNRTQPAIALVTLIFVTIGGACSAPVEDGADRAAGSEGDTAVVLGHRHVLRSELLGEDRELSVYLPNGYESSESLRYPLVVLLDGRMAFTSMAAMIHTLSEGGAIPRAIVVGILNTDRWRDLTPIEGMGIPGTGGGEAFLASLAGEILPYIDSKWRTNGFRVFSGHSLGGLTTLNALQESPGLFDAYLSLSPSLEWGEGFTPILTPVSARVSSEPADRRKPWSRCSAPCRWPRTRECKICPITREWSTA